jgi:hypothetical protein
VLVESGPSGRRRAAALAPWLVDVTRPLLGLGPVVDLGFGDRTLSRLLAAQGCSVDVIDLTSASPNDLNEPIEAAFLVHVLEWLAPVDLVSFLRDMRRVVARDMFVVVDTRVGQGRDHGVRSRGWWEDRLLDAGFACHPLGKSKGPYVPGAREGDVVLLAAQRLPDGLLEKLPREAFLEERGCQADMLATRRSLRELAKGLETSQRKVEVLTSQLVAIREHRLRWAADDPRGVAVFGTCRSGRRFARLWRRKGGFVACFLDNDPETWNTTVDGIPVQAPSSLSHHEFALVIVASVAYDAIAEQLTRMGLVAEWDFTGWVDVPGAAGHHRDG